MASKPEADSQAVFVFSHFVCRSLVAPTEDNRKGTAQAATAHSTMQQGGCADCKDSASQDTSFRKGEDGEEKLYHGVLHKGARSAGLWTEKGRWLCALP